jgi:hypothetical protein
MIGGNSMMRVRHILLALVAAGFMSTAQADPRWARGDDDQDFEHEGKHDRGSRHHREDRDNWREREGYHDHWRFEDRNLVSDYYRRNPHHLPPGLAKRGDDSSSHEHKDDGPRPLARGEVVTAEHEPFLIPLPRDLEIKLPPPPGEVIRRITGHDIVIINKIDHKVMDVLRNALP